MISCIEPSPFDPGTAYVAATRYKLDDYRAVSLRHARLRHRHWSPDQRRHPEDDFTRVIRADPAAARVCSTPAPRPASTSRSTTAANWQRFQLNLPVSPIHDLLIKGSDLIAGTHGRSIWILDDLTPLRALAEGTQGGVPDGEPYLFAPRDTTRVLPGIDWGDEVAGSTNYLTCAPAPSWSSTSTDGETIRTNLDVGENPPAGVIVTYRLAAAPGGADRPDLPRRERRGDPHLLQPQRGRPAPGEGAPGSGPGGLEPLRLGYAARPGDADRGDRSPPARSQSRVRWSLPASYTVTLTVGDKRADPVLPHPQAGERGRHPG